MEFLEHIINDCLLVFHGKHPNTEIFCLIFLTELFARQSQKGKCDFVSIDFMIMFCDLNRFIVKQRSICHLNGNFQAILMCQSLLCLENIQRFCQKSLISDVLFLSLSGHGCRILWNHLRAMDDVYNKFVHLVLPPLDVFYIWTALLRNRLFYGSSITRESHSVNV